MCKCSLDRISLLHYIWTLFALHWSWILIATHCPANALASMLWVALHRNCTTNVFWIWFAGVFCYLLSLCQLYNVQRLHIYFTTHCRKAQNWAKILCNALYKNSTSKSCIWGSAVFLPEFVLYLFCICICVVSFICICIFIFICISVFIFICICVFIFICICVFLLFVLEFLFVFLFSERVWFCNVFRLIWILHSNDLISFHIIIKSNVCIIARWSLAVGK